MTVVCEHPRCIHSLVEKCVELSPSARAFLLVDRQGLSGSVVLKGALEQGCCQQRFHLLEISLFPRISSGPAVELVTDRIEQQPQTRCVEREIDGAFGSVHHSPASVTSIVRLRRTHC